jgi:hypothetical protein
MTRTHGVTLPHRCATVTRTRGVTLPQHVGTLRAGVGHHRESDPVSHRQGRRSRGAAAFRRVRTSQAEHLRCPDRLPVQWQPKGTSLQPSFLHREPMLDAIPNRKGPGDEG